MNANRPTKSTAPRMNIPANNTAGRRAAGPSGGLAGGPGGGGGGVCGSVKVASGPRKRGARTGRPRLLILGARVKCESECAKRGEAGERPTESENRHRPSRFRCRSFDATVEVKFSPSKPPETP